VPRHAACHWVIAKPGIKLVVLLITCGHTDAEQAFARLRTAASAKLSKCVCELTHLTLMSLLVRVFTRSAIAYWALATARP